jgi:hypothetical protein
MSSANYKKKGSGHENERGHCEVAPTVKGADESSK